MRKRRQYNMDMVDELYELVMGENGFVVEVRCGFSLDHVMYSKIKE